MWCDGSMDRWYVCMYSLANLICEMVVRIDDMILYAGSKNMWNDMVWYGMMVVEYVVWYGMVVVCICKMIWFHGSKHMWYDKVWCRYG